MPSFRDTFFLLSIESKLSDPRCPRHGNKMYLVSFFSFSFHSFLEHFTLSRNDYEVNSEIIIKKKNSKGERGEGKKGGST